MAPRLRASWVVAALTVVVGCVTTTVHVAAHSSLVSPLEETYDNACRIGGVNRHKGVNCPDGEYVLGYAWYGGSFQQGDYYSCARVRVKGGAPLRQSYTAILEHARNGKCDSTANKLGICRREPCRGRRRTPMKPAEFNGSPPKILSSRVDARMGSPEKKDNGRKSGNNGRKNNKWRKNNWRKNQWRRNQWRRNQNRWKKNKNNKRWQKK
ncbi:hypothetical protein I4F81_004264 [Pyropia yezoensis]|uniref:Uncharacterized protein n=1 Tax=Pyropia yezoensis TaxID=2788 RepID=A0ACC3BUU7_PYRYE|nr:hypothetical protein I4F81_004264 [Neopyropia yezoensis]